ncbi:UNVERIFIED_CONTAM: hypothetical protein RKD43_006239 [Streptomyces graminofaciens]
MQGIGSRPRLHVSADGAGVVGHAGGRLLADLADVTGLTSAYSTVLRPLRPRGTGHDPGRIATDLAVMLADGGETITDLAVLRDQGEVFGPVASTPTTWRLLAGVDERALDRLRSARAQAREVAWLQASETRCGIPPAKARRTGTARPGPGHRRHTDHLPLREGGGRTHLQRRLRLPSSGVFPGQHRRGHVRAAAARERQATRPRTTSRFWTTLSRRSPTPTGTAPTSKLPPGVTGRCHIHDRRQHLTVTGPPPPAALRTYELRRRHHPSKQLPHLVGHQPLSKDRHAQTND